MTYRYKPLTDDDLSELHAAAYMADASGFLRVQVEPESVVSMVEELKELRAKMADPQRNPGYFLDIRTRHEQGERK